MIDINKMTMRQYLAVNKAMYYATAGKDWTSVQEKVTEAMKYIARGRADQAHNELQAVLFTCQMLQAGESPFIDVLEAFKDRGDVLEMTHEECVDFVEDVKKKCSNS
jgi:hypothetical protein